MKSAHRSTRVSFALGLAPLALMAVGASATTVTTTVTTHDHEWPPQVDARSGQNTLPSSEIFMDSIALQIPEPYATWVVHFHATANCAACTGFGNTPTEFAIGDVDGDGSRDDIVISLAGEALLAAEMQIAWTLNGQGEFAPTGQLNVLWFWLSPIAQDPAGLNCDPNQGTQCAGCDPPRFMRHTANNSLTGSTKPLIWDFDPSTPAEEVAIVGLDANAQKRLFLLRTRLASEPAVQHCNVPDLAPTQIALTPLNPAVIFDTRLGICKVRDTAIPLDIVMGGHDGDTCLIWKYNGTSTLELTFQIDVPGDRTGVKSSSHEFNWRDVDGDGFDEFFFNGLVDFVDRDPSTGQAVPANPANPQFGIARWQIVYGREGLRGHTDQVYVADWDPTHCGLEVYAVTEEGSNGWHEVDRSGIGINDPDCQIDPESKPKCWQAGTQHPRNLDVLYDLEGNLLDEWGGAPYVDGQAIHAGDWTETHKGLESFVTPKDLQSGATLKPPWGGGASCTNVIRVTPAADSIDDDFIPLAVDGQLATGADLCTGGPWGNTWPVDWDGDYATDEILHLPTFGAVRVWRMGAKASLPPPGSPRPAGMPDQAQVATTVPPPVPGGHVYWYYQGQPDWNWNNDAPGRFTHYFEKLGEDFPQGSAGALCVQPYDLPGTDYREEIVAITFGAGNVKNVVVYFHLLPLSPAILQRESPRNSVAYRAWRLSPHEMVPPFEWKQEVPQLRIQARPTDPDLPSSVVGTPLVNGSPLTLEAVMQLGDGSTQPIPPSVPVTWIPDPDTAGIIDIAQSGVVSINAGAAATAGITQLSARFRAEVPILGGTVSSSPVYVLATNSQAPVVLMAGFSDSWLVNDLDLDRRDLRIEALVAQRDNLPPPPSGGGMSMWTMTVKVLNLDGTHWKPEQSAAGIVLKDNGVNGDVEARDGVYTVVLDPPPISDDPNLEAPLTVGENLKVIRATLTSEQPDPPPPFVSDPWPYFKIGATSTAPSNWPPAVSPYTGYSETNAFEAPRVRVFGDRGWRQAGKFFVEAELISAPQHPKAALSAVVGFGANFQVLSPRGGTTFVRHSNTALAPDLYLFQLVGLSSGGSFKSDSYPQIRLHTFPAMQCEDSGW